MDWKKFIELDGLKLGIYVARQPKDAFLGKQALEFLVENGQRLDDSHISEILFILNKTGAGIRYIYSKYIYSKSNSVRYQAMQHFFDRTDLSLDEVKSFIRSIIDYPDKTIAVDLLDILTKQTKAEVTDEINKYIEEMRRLIDVSEMK